MSPLGPKRKFKLTHDPQSGFLDVAAAGAYGTMASWPDDRRFSFTGEREESPGSTEKRCRVTPGGGDPRESATEIKPLADYPQQG